ncbi:MAG: hypothetical protein ACRDQD_19925, partial [Nocardioidaceae bacterium]
GEHGGSIPAHTPVRIMDLHTRRERYEQLDTALDYRGEQIGRAVMNPSQIRSHGIGHERLDGRRDLESAILANSAALAAVRASAIRARGLRRR